MEAAESLCLCSCYIQILPQEHVDRIHARACPACAVDIHHLWPDISPCFFYSTLDSQPGGRSLNPSLSQFRGLWDTSKCTSVARHGPLSTASFVPHAGVLVLERTFFTYVYSCNTVTTTYPMPLGSASLQETLDISHGKGSSSDMPRPGSDRQHHEEIPEEQEALSRQMSYLLRHGGQSSGSDRQQHDELPEELEALSKRMSYLLRHGGPSSGMYMNSQGWCKIRDLIAIINEERWRVQDVLIVATESRRAGCCRFEVDDSGKWVRATGKHTCLNQTDDTGKASGRMSQTSGKAGEVPLVRSFDQERMIPSKPSRSPPRPCTPEHQHAVHDPGHHDLAQADAAHPSELQDHVAGDLSVVDTHVAAGLSPAEPLARSDVLGASSKSLAETSPQTTVLIKRVQSSTYRWWQCQADPNTPFKWWINEEKPHDAFREDDPGAWRKYHDPTNQLVYWWHENTEEWFYIE